MSYPFGSRVVSYPLHGVANYLWTEWQVIQQECNELWVFLAQGKLSHRVISELRGQQLAAEGCGQLGQPEADRHFWSQTGRYNQGILGRGQPATCCKSAQHNM